MKNVLERLCEVIEYPDTVPGNVSAYTLQVDGGEVWARIIGNRLVLSRVIDREENDLKQLATFATGRILKEEAVLAWDERTQACILWQELADSADDAKLRHFFEMFMVSCDWWLERAGELGAPPPVFPDIVIRP